MEITVDVSMVKTADYPAVVMAGASVVIFIFIIYWNKLFWQLIFSFSATELSTL